MQIKRAYPWIALGIGAIVAFAVVKWWGEHRQARLEDAFRILAEGADRLNASDIAGAQQQFGAAIERFEALRRDPLMAVHYSFAARLRERQAAALREARELAVPGAPSPEAQELAVPGTTSPEAQERAVPGAARPAAQELEVPDAASSEAKKLATPDAASREPKELAIPAAAPPEAKELAVPGTANGDTLLDLALSDDSSLLAVATRTRLLCLTTAKGQWKGWPLPHPIEKVGALHVDAESGRVHLVARDDGKLLTADCRKDNATLSATSSPTGNKAAVAWLDVEEQMAWLAPANPNGAEVTITARPLPGAGGEPREIKVSFPGEANTLFPDAAVIHSIGKVDGNILLFYGDANRAHDADLRDESVLVISVDDPERKTNRLVFAAAAKEDAAGKTRWQSTHVRRVLPASAPGRVYALTEGPHGVSVLGADAKPIDTHSDALFATEYHDGREIYDLNVTSADSKAIMEVSRRGTDTRFRYELPWRLEGAPALAAISNEGRRVVVANSQGGLLFIDLTQSPGR